MGAEYRNVKREDLHVHLAACKETYMATNMKMTYVGSRGSWMWSEGGGC